MGFFDNLRGRAAPQQQPAPNQQPNGNQGTQTTTGGPGTLPGGAGNNVTGTNPGSQSALELHAGLYDPPKAGGTDEVPKFALDGTKLNDVAKAQNFMQGHEALLQAVQGGDLSKLGELIQASTRAAYRSALEHSSTLTDKFVDARFGHFDKGFSGRVKGELTGQALSDTPGFSNPVVRQQLNDIAARLRAQHPDAPPQDIAQEAKRILTEMADSINPKAKQKDTSEGAGNNYPILEQFDGDYAKYLEA